MSRRLSLSKIKDTYAKLNIALSKKATSTLEKVMMTEHTFMIVIAVIIGILAGFGAIIIRSLIKWVSTISFPGTSDLLSNIMAQPWYVIVFVPALGGAIVGPLIYFFAREAKGHGVPEVMQAILLKGGIIRPRVAIVKAIASVLTIGTGGSVGREGPIVQIGSSIGSSVGQFFRVSDQRLTTFVGCGAAAGIAAAFNAPIAGALFAVEIILQDFAFSQFSPIVISSVTATVISHHFEGNFSAFQVPPYMLTNPKELFFYFILAILCAIVGFLFIRVLYFCEDFFDDKLKIPEYLKPIIGGLLIGGIALIFPQVMGVGYESINNALHGKTIWYMAFVLIFIKIIATSFTLGSGGSGGIFAPSLFLGAMTGVSFGSVIHNLFPSITATPGAYALVAMGGLVAATTQAPITAIIIVFELTNDYHIILPLMITCIVSTIVSTKFSRESIYTLKLLRRNIHIKDGTEVNIMKSLYVKDIYTESFETILVTEDFDHIVKQLISGRDPYLLVIDKNKNYQGIISINSIKEYLFEKDIFHDLLIADDIADKKVETVLPEDNCQIVLDKISKSKLEGMPVLDPKNKKHVLGIIWRKNILDAYNREIMRRDVTSSLASQITMKENSTTVQFMEGYSIAEVKVPSQYVGKSIKELNIRNRYGVDILLIKSASPGRGPKMKAIPSPDHIFTEKDYLVIAGEIKNINMFKKM
ncbi:MAG: chloride channel protein [bacterium]|nr:chloride channel protein [bacterium]MBU1917870.1 chloride channel protein [bacterium]